MKDKIITDNKHKRRDFVRISALSGISAALLGLLPKRLFGLDNSGKVSRKNNPMPEVKLHPLAIKRNNKG